MRVGGTVLKAYILSIAGVILLTSVVAAIAPNGKMGAFVRGMTKLLVLAVVTAPLISVLKTGKFEFTAAEIQTDSAFLGECAAIVSEEDEREISAYLSDLSLSAEVRAERSSDGLYTMKKITVKITDFGIFGQDEHIDMIDRIQSDLQDRYGCETVVYEEG